MVKKMLLSIGICLGLLGNGCEAEHTPPQDHSEILEERLETDFSQNCPSRYFEDKDGDGYGNMAIYICEPLPGYVEENSDCDDNDPKTYPNAPELCDGKANSCGELRDNDIARVCSSTCGKGTEYCVEGEWKNCTAPQPKEESKTCLNNSVYQVDGCGIVEGLVEECGFQEICLSDRCCTLDCYGKECGDDGCGGSCGGCKTGKQCHENKCGAKCGQSWCYNDKICGDFKDSICINMGEKYCGKGVICKPTSECCADPNSSIIPTCITPEETCCCPAGCDYQNWLDSSSPENSSPPEPEAYCSYPEDSPSMNIINKMYHCAKDEKCCGREVCAPKDGACCLDPRTTVKYNGSDWYFKSHCSHEPSEVFACAKGEFCDLDHCSEEDSCYKTMFESTAEGYITTRYGYCSKGEVCEAINLKDNFWCCPEDKPDKCSKYVNDNYQGDFCCPANKSCKEQDFNQCVLPPAFPHQ